MNKIILDKSKFIELNVSEDSICNISKDYVLNELNVNISDNVKFVINHYSEIKDNNLNVNIFQNNNSEFIYNYSFLNNGDYNLNININMNGNKSKNVINIHGISDFCNTNIVVNGLVNEKTIDNELDEKIKMLNINNGKSNIMPNMFIDTKNVVANHAASVKDIDEDYLFYLKSKGIDDEDAKKLIINGFLYNEAKE